MKHSVPMQHLFSLPVSPPRPVERDLPDLIQLAASALAGLAMIGLQTQYDLAAFRLRALLQKIDRTPNASLPDVDPDAATLFWRLQILDRHCNTHFLTGLANLSAWGKRLLAQDSARDLHAPVKEQQFLAQQRDLGGLLTGSQRDHLWRAVCQAS